MHVKVARRSSVGDAELSIPTLVPAPAPAPAPGHTPLALILLFWETSAAALACQSKGVLEFNTMIAAEMESVLQGES